MTEKLVNQNWWKFLGVGLLLYSIIAGMIIPLKPGIIDVKPSSAFTGDTILLYATLYNGNLSNEGKQLNAWLKTSNEHIIQAQSANATGKNSLELTFVLPLLNPLDQTLASATLIIDSPSGPAVYPSALFITKQESKNPEVKYSSLWSDSISNLHQGKGIKFPFRNILVETIRNTFFHIALWMAMFVLFFLSLMYSIRYLQTNQYHHDLAASSLNQVGALFGLMGFATGMLWAKFTWGDFWPSDVKLNMTAIALLIYMAYFVLRGAIDDGDKKARLSAVYNVFAFAALIPLVFIIPRLTDSLHPGNGGNPALGGEDLDNTLRLVFYPAILGWILFGGWLASLTYRASKLQLKLFER